MTYKFRFPNGRFNDTARPSFRAGIPLCATYFGVLLVSRLFSPSSRPFCLLSCLFPPELSRSVGSIVLQLLQPVLNLTIGRSFSFQLAILKDAHTNRNPSSIQVEHRQHQSPSLASSRNYSPGSALAQTTHALHDVHEEMPSPASYFVGALPGQPRRGGGRRRRRSTCRLGRTWWR